MLGWYAALRPGLMSADSLEIWRQATQGNWVDLHPPLYTFAVWLSSLVVHDPSLVTLGQSLFVAAAIVAVARAVRRLGAPASAVAVVTGAVAVSPMLGTFAMSVWKDVPYTAAVLLVAARVIDLASFRLAGEGEDGSRTLRSLTLWLAVAVAFRQNGILLAFVLLAVLVVVLGDRRRAVALAAAVVVVVFVLLKVAVYPIAGVTASPAQASLAMFMHDIAAVARSNPEGFEPDDRVLMDRIAPFAVWRAQSARFGCASANWEWLPEFAWTRVEGRADDYLRLWRETLTEQPRRVLANRLCVGAIAWRPDSQGVLYTVSRGIDANGFGLETKPIVGGLDRAAADVLDATDRPAVQWLLWRGPPWIYASWIAVVLAAVRRRRAVVLLAALPSAALQLSVLPVNPAQDARYMFAGILLGALLLPVGLGRKPGTPTSPPATGSSIGVDGSNGTDSAGSDTPSPVGDQGPSVRVADVVGMKMQVPKVGVLGVRPLPQIPGSDRRTAR